MSAYEQSLWAAVRNRLTSDATLVSLAGGGIAWEQLPTGVGIPAITINQTSISNRDAFTTMIDEVNFDVHVWAESAGVGTDGGDPASTCATIMERIRGDWMDQATRIPSFGLDRHQLTLSGSSCLATLMERTTGWVAAHEGTDIHWYMSFHVFISKGIP